MRARKQSIVIQTLVYINHTRKALNYSSALPYSHPSSLSLSFSFPLAVNLRERCAHESNEHMRASGAELAQRARKIVRRKFWSARRHAPRALVWLSTSRNNIFARRAGLSPPSSDLIKLTNSTLEIVECVVAADARSSCRLFHVICIRAREREERRKAMCARS